MKSTEPLSLFELNEGLNEIQCWQGANNTEAKPGIMMSKMLIHDGHDKPNRCLPRFAQGKFGKGLWVFCDVT